MLSLQFIVLLTYHVAKFLQTIMFVPNDYEIKFKFIDPYEVLGILEVLQHNLKSTIEKSEVGRVTNNKVTNSGTEQHFNEKCANW